MNGYTFKCKKVLDLAKTYASQSGNAIESYHILAALANVENSYASEILTRLGFSSEIANSYLLKTITPAETTALSDIAVSILDYADKLCTKLGYKEVDTQHILLAVCFFKNALAAKILLRYEIDYAKILSIVNAMSYNKIGQEGSPIEEKIVKQETLTKKTVLPDILKENGVDLTEIARNKKNDEIIGREKEISRIIQILSRRKKNNPMIVGESGVGKTALVEGLAQRIVKNEVPDFLKNKTIFSLNMTSIMSGTRYRGDMEEKLKNLFSALENENIILFIDEIHSISSAGGNDSSFNVANIIKPYLLAEKFPTIGATTIGEYRKFIESDPALERRFMTVDVKEATVEDTILILKGVKSSLERHHNIIISEDTLVAAATLSDRYIADRFLPDKAIDVLDEACSKKVTQRKGNTKIKLAKKDILAIIEEMTDIPVTEMNKTQTMRLINMEEELNKRIIGQEEAVSVICKTIKRARAGLKESKRPIGSFIFLGSSGVGKTETAKALANFLFGNENALIRFDMSEYMEKASVARLIGASPGYVGYEEGGLLTEQVRRKPYSVILLDELEKANFEVFNLLLQVLDDGRITDSKGRVVSFKNTIIIMTGNVGAELLTKSDAIGFAKAESKSAENKRKEVILSELKKTLRPEFLNRIDNIVVFNELSKDNLLQIANILIERLKKVLIKEKGIKLIVDDDVIKFITETSFDILYGARPLQRSIETVIEDRLSEEILKNGLKNTTVSVKLVNNNIEFIN